MPGRLLELALIFIEMGVRARSHKLKTFHSCKFLQRVTILRKVLVLVSLWKTFDMIKVVHQLYKSREKHTVKSVQNGLSQKEQKLGFKTKHRLMQVKSIAECSKGSILQYCRPSLSYCLSLRPLFCLFLCGRFTQVLLHVFIHINSVSPDVAFMCSIKPYCG